MGNKISTYYFTGCGVIASRVRLKSEWLKDRAGWSPVTRTI